MGSSATAGLARAPGLFETAKRAFFRSFFRLLLAFVALAEWVSVAWGLHVAGVHAPLPLHVFAPLAIYRLNRRIVTRRTVARGRLRDALVRGYVAFAFTSIFCALFLAIAGVGALLILLVPGEPGHQLRAGYVWFV